MNGLSILKHPCAFLPMAMSVVALTTVLAFIVLHGPAPQQDEGAAAHLWQLLMAGQIPIMLFFAVKWLPQLPREGAIVMALQLFATLAAIAPVYLLGW